MLYNINWDVCPNWVRFLNREARTENNEDSTSKRQKHVHEFLGSTKIAEEDEEAHNHRFAGVSGEAIPTSNGSHKHTICTRTDFFDHLHEIEDCTGPAINVGNGRHVHYVKGRTTVNDGHSHRFQFATLIESPIILRD